MIDLIWQRVRQSLMFAVGPGCENHYQSEKQKGCFVSAGGYFCSSAFPNEFGFNANSSLSSPRQSEIPPILGVSNLEGSW